MAGEELSLEERVQIELAVSHAKSCRAIGLMLDRAPSTVSREVQRNGGSATYSAVAAHERAARCRSRPKQSRFQTDRLLAAHVEKRLKAKDSPMTISQELSTGAQGTTATLSHQTIYNSVYAHGKRGLAKGLHKCLHRQHRTRKAQRNTTIEQPAKTGPLGCFNLITQRPPVAGLRIEPGHFEGDLIVGSFNRSAIVTVVDRMSRNLWLADLPEGNNAEQVLGALIEIMERVPPKIRRTLTWDQGREMALHETLTKTVGIDVYFAHPHSPWERPTNEHTNGIIRRYVGKGTNLNNIKLEKLQAIEHRINTTPRRIHNWQTAQHVYTHTVALTN
jgi:transposase, IS30 family